MKLSDQELNELKSFLSDRQMYTEEVVLGRLSSAYNKFFSSFTSFFRLLCDEDIIKEDPYKMDYSLNTLELPDETPIPYNEEEYSVTIRLSHYYALLEHIRENVTLNLDYLTFEKLEKLHKIITFLNWERLFDLQPPGINSEALNKILFHYQKDRGHTFVTSTLKSTNKNIFIYSKDVIKELTDITIYQSEMYKLWIRENILPQIKLPPELKGENIKKAHDMISQKIKDLDKPLYISLIGEVLKEDFSPEGVLLRKEILKKLEISNLNPKNGEKVEKKLTTKELLELSLTELSKASSQIEPITTKLSENAEMHRETTYNILDKFFDYLKYSLLLMKRETFYNVKLIEKKNEKPIEKELLFEKFISSIASTQNKIENYRNKENQEFLELFSQNENDIQLQIHKLISKVRYCYKVASALDSFFKTELNTPKGIQVELKAIHSILNKSQAFYLEFTKLKEESKKNSI